MAISFTESLEEDMEMDARKFYDRFPTDEYKRIDVKEDSYIEDYEKRERKITFHLSKDEQKFISKVAKERDLSFDVAYRELHNKAFQLLMEFNEFKRRIDNVCDFIETSR